MKVVTQRDELAQKLGVVARAVSTRATRPDPRPAFSLRRRGGRLHLAATDMELSLRSSLDAQVDGEGAVVVPGRLLVDLVRLLPDSEVTIEHRPEESVVHVDVGLGHLHLHTYAAEDFPRLPEVDAVADVHRRTATRCSRRSRVSRARRRATSRGRCSPGSSSASRPGKLVMAATDSYRLSVKETRARAATVPELEAIIPARALGELARIAQAGDDIELGVHENQVVFGCGRRLADDAPDRRPVPELQAAAARGVRARGDAAARRVARRRPPRRA